MAVFPLKPTLISGGEITIPTEVITSKSGNEQRIGHLVLPKRKYTLQINGIPLNGSVDLNFNTQYMISFPYYNFQNFDWFFSKIARGRMNSFILKAYPSFFYSDILVRFDSDSFTQDYISNSHCNISVAVITC